MHSWKKLGSLLPTAVAAGVFVYLSALKVDLQEQASLAVLVLIVLWGLDRLPRLKVLRMAFLALAGFLILRYLFWRTFTTLGFDDPLSFAAALALYSAEGYGIGMWFLSAFTNACPIDHPSRPEMRVWPSVDVYVPTYDEPEEIVKITLTAAKAMNYPASRLNVYLLDDGSTWARRHALDLATAKAAWERHSKLQALCRSLGVRYLTRKDNTCAKAGNLNAALKVTDGELIAVLDCDHVPTVDFLQETVPYFADPQVFLVQTPHFFATPDPIEKNLGLFDRMPSENAMFYQAVQLGLDFWGASFFCGSAAVLRRKALVAAGGFSGQTVTEDAETALRLHARGWRSVYLKKPLVAGLQPETFASLVRQRMRWAQGMIQLFCLANPLRLQGLSLGQRLAYLNCMGFWFFPLARVVFLLAPLGYLLLGLKIYDAGLAEIGAYTLPYLVALFFTQGYLFGRVRWAFVSEIYESMLSLFSLKAVLSALRNPKTPKFSVTPKGEQLPQDFISPLATPFYGLLVLVLAGFAFAFWRWQAFPAERPMVLITGFWNLGSLLIVTASLGALYERRQRRRHPRLPAGNLPARLELKALDLPVRLADVSVGGAGLHGISIPLPLKEIGCLSFEHPVLYRPVRVKVQIVEQSLPAQSLGVRFLPASVEEYRALVLLVYGDSRRWQAMLAKRQSRVGVVRALGVLLACAFRQAAEHLAALGKRIVSLGETEHAPILEPYARPRLHEPERAVR
ncbi:UDP-forming cellulose synthase catalytic subunit [Methylothermus subterraneus]